MKHFLEVKTWSLNIERNLPRGFCNALYFCRPNNLLTQVQSLRDKAQVKVKTPGPFIAGISDIMAGQEQVITTPNQ